jgi:hypothetical protein
MAGTTVRVEADERGTARQTVTYTVTNDRREPVRWVRIGSGGPFHTEAVPQQHPVIATTPENWQGRIEYPAETNELVMVWEATDARYALPSRSRTDFAIEVAGPQAVPPRQLGKDGKPVRPIPFTGRPFTAGGDAGCWWGWTSRPESDQPRGGRWAGSFVTTVRPFSAAGRDYVIVDTPAWETHLRFSDTPVFLTMPLTLSWGVKGGFSHNASIGIGLRWSPIEYVSVYAQTHIGTFLLTNHTHLHHVGFDINIPRYTTDRSTGAISRNKYYVFGIEYFDRRAVKWIGYLDGPQWYASGRGVAIRFAIRQAAWSWN